MAIGRAGSRASHTAGAVMMLALLLFLDAAAPSLTLHGWICPDAGQTDHQCAVTHFAAGQIEPPWVAVDSGTVFLGVLTMPLGRNETYPASRLFRLSPSRAPPASFA